MKFRVMMKDPDGPSDCITDAARDSLAAIEGISDSEREALLETREQELTDFAGKWLRYGEYVNLEFDTEAGTVTVLPHD